MGKWNENQYVMELMEKYEVVAFNHLISVHNNDKLKELYPFVPNDITTNLGAVRGASLWLKNK